MPGRCLSVVNLSDCGGTGSTIISLEMLDFISLKSTCLKILIRVGFFCFISWCEVYEQAGQY